MVTITKLPPGEALGARDLQNWATGRMAERVPPAKGGKIKPRGWKPRKRRKRDKHPVMIPR